MEDWRVVSHLTVAHCGTLHWQQQQLRLFLVVVKEVWSAAHNDSSVASLVPKNV